LKRLAAVALLFTLPAQARGKPPEAIAACSHDRTATKHVVLTHLGGCRQRTLKVRGLVGGLGDAGDGWSLALATDRGVHELRRRGCPTAVVCTSGNELAALQEQLGQDEWTRQLHEVKSRARPRLREGAAAGPIVPWD
jgi:hypothetical protein